MVSADPDIVPNYVAFTDPARPADNVAPDRPVIP